MKNKKYLLPVSILLVAVLLMTVFCIVAGITKKPVITEKEFPFSITYELDGKTEVIEGTYTCSYDGIAYPQYRYYSGSVLGKADSDQTKSYIIYKGDDGQITLETNFYPDYLMGDPMYDYYTDGFEYRPFLIYNDSDGMDVEEGYEISQHNAKVVDWDYPEPIKNSLEFSHIYMLDGSRAFPLAVIGLLAVLATIIFVKKEQDVVYTVFDKISRVINVIVGLILIPFGVIVLTISDIIGVYEGFMGQFTYCAPAIMALGIAASIALRRKGCSKSGFLMQIITMLLFILVTLV